MRRLIIYCDDDDDDDDNDDGTAVKCVTIRPLRPVRKALFTVS